MNFRASLLILCLAGLAVVIWNPKEVGEGDQEKVASGQGEPDVGELMDVSSYELARAEEPVVEDETVQAEMSTEPKVAAQSPGSLRGRDRGSLADQGEILAHDPMAMETYLSSTDLHPGRERFLETCAYIALEQLNASEELWRTVADADPVTSVERAAVNRLLGGSGGGAAVPASSQGNNAVIHGLEMAYIRGELRGVLRDRDYPAACGLLSRLLELELTADWAPHAEALTSWAKQLNEAQGFHRWNSKGEWPSQEYVVKQGDSLVAVRKHVITERPELNLCTGLIARANQLRDENSIHPGQKLRIPLDPVRTQVDLSSRFLLYYHGEELVCAWPVTIGRDGRTIPGEYAVGDKQMNPAWWYPKGYEPVAEDADPHGEGYIPFGHSENPLGTRWIPWKGSNGLGYHGTSKEDQIGGEASDGCIRLRNRDLEALFEILPVGSPILVQP